MVPTHKTSYIILRKIPFQETSLIVSGFSEEYGRLDFLLKGARGNGAKKFPYAELFRELAIEFHPPKIGGEMCRMTGHEPLEMFDSIVRSTENYLKMCDFAAFLLKHTGTMLEFPETYHALKTLLTRLTRECNPLFLVSLAKLIFLQESGFLPETEDGDPKREQLLQILFSCALNPEVPLPPLSEQYQNKFSAWIHDLCVYHELQ